DPIEVGFGLLHRRLRADFRSLRLLELQLVGLGLDREQRRASLDEGAVLVIDRGEEALHPRHQVDLLDRRGVAGRFQVSGDRALQRGCDIYLGRRRRYVSVLLASGEEGERERGDRKRSEMCEAPAVRIGCKLHGAAPLFWWSDSNIRISLRLARFANVRIKRTTSKY